MSQWIIKEVAFSVPFDPDNNPNCNITSENVQEAIEELCLDISANPFILAECLNGDPACYKSAELIVDHTLCYVGLEDC